MGEVYRAHDSRLDRTVAIKVLTEGTAADPDRRIRFESEARAVAALNHPNIVAIFDFGEADGAPYSVSELIEGESLRTMLKGGPVSVKRLLDIAVQVADGLAAAHAAGIAHRDLKPENIMVTPLGQAKILDFGLARRVLPPNNSHPDGETRTVFVTGPGTIIGTPNYMSPEQALGKPTDYRSDQFSFGLILFELASGKQAFAGPSTVETLAAIVRDEAPPAPPNLPAPLRWIIDRCLAKNPLERYDSTRDLLYELRSLRNHLSESYSTNTLAAVSAPHKRFPWHILAWSLACLFAILAAAGIYQLRSAPPDLSRYNLKPLYVGEDARQAPSSWSPDGKAVTFVTRDPLTRERGLMVRYIAAPVGSRIYTGPLIEGVIRWSPDSRRIFFYGPDSDHPGTTTIYSISSLGGDPVVERSGLLMPLISARPDLSPDGQNVAYFCACDGQHFGLYTTPLHSTATTRYTPFPFPERSPTSDWLVRFSPDGKSILAGLAGNNQVEFWTLRFPAGSGKPRRALTAIARQELLREVNWMPDDRHIVGSIGQSPELVYADTQSDDWHQLTKTDGYTFYPAVSPDGLALTFIRLNTNLDITTADLKTGQFHPFIYTKRNESAPSISADQSRTAYLTDRNGDTEIWLRAADGSTNPLVTEHIFPPAEGLGNLDSPAISPDGHRVIFCRTGNDGRSHAWLASVDQGTVERLLDTPGEEQSGVWSPDGKRYAFLQGSAADTHLAVLTVGSSRPPDILTGRISNTIPTWSPDGASIAYQDGSTWKIISPDTRKITDVMQSGSIMVTFSADSRRLYYVNRVNGVSTFSSIEIATGKKADLLPIPANVRPAGTTPGGWRLSLLKDGNSLLYTSGSFNSSLWLLRNFEPPSLLDRLFGRR